CRIPINIHELSVLLRIRKVGRKRWKLRNVNLSILAMNQIVSQGVDIFLTQVSEGCHSARPRTDDFLHLLLVQAVFQVAERRNFGGRALKIGSMAASTMS